MFIPTWYDRIPCNHYLHRPQLLASTEDGGGVGLNVAWYQLDQGFNCPERILRTVRLDTHKFVRRPDAAAIASVARHIHS